MIMMDGPLSSLQKEIKWIPVDQGSLALLKIEWNNYTVQHADIFLYIWLALQNRNKLKFWKLQKWNSFYIAILQILSAIRGNTDIMVQHKMTNSWSYKSDTLTQ